MQGVEEILNKLRARADEADRMEEQIARLTRNLQRCNLGASGDESPQPRVRSACKQCSNYADEVHQIKSRLDSEIQNNISTEAERDFLRQRVRALDVREAEMILYKTKYEESECKLMLLKELLVRADMNAKELRELRSKLLESECKLKEADQHIEDLIVSFKLEKRFSK